MSKDSSSHPDKKIIHYLWHHKTGKKHFYKTLKSTPLHDDSINSMESFHNQIKGAMISCTENFLFLKLIKYSRAMFLFKEILVPPPTHKSHHITSEIVITALKKKFFTCFLPSLMQCFPRLCA